MRPHLEDGLALTSVAQTAGLPLRTAQRWAQRYRRQGLAGLAHQPHRDRGQRTLPAELHRLIEGLALRSPPPSSAAVHRQVTTVAQREGWPVPSYSTVYDVVRRLEPALVLLAHEGAKAYGETFDLLFRREASRPNEVWQADHTLLDLWVVGERGQPARPWLSVILDDYSRAVAGYRLRLEAPTALATALTLREAIWRKADPRWHVCGIPDLFYTDHGADFTSTHLEQVAADLAMQLSFSTVGRPRGRGRIERFFETVNQLCLHQLPGRVAPGSPPAKPVLTLAALDERLRTFFLDEYQRRVHGETGVTPADRWAAGAFLPRLPESLEQLDLLLLTVRTSRRVQQDGIRFHGFRYLDLTLAAYVGETVTIRYDPRDLAEIRVYLGDQFLCRAICQELAGLTISLNDIVRARNERRRHLRVELSARAQIVESLLLPAAPVDPPDVAPPAPLTDPPRPPGLKRYWHE